jgi:hypothetical protein
MTLGPRRTTMRASIASGQVRRKAAERPTRLQILRRGEVDKLLSGPFGARARRLFQFMSHMSLRDGATLVTVMRADGWPDAPLATRELVLGIVNNKIVAMRLAAGLPEFDDPLEPDAMNVSMKLRQLLAVP